MADVAASLSCLYLSSNDCHPSILLSAHPALTMSGGQASKHSDYCSVRALKLLSNIEFETRRCSRLLSAATKGSYNTVKRELTALQRATQSICCKSDLVVLRKAEVLNALDELEHQLMQSQDSMEPKGPVEFNSSKYMYLGITNEHTAHSF